jgi:leucyl/phenylalanyl-tRNA--protein transferase
MSPSDLPSGVVRGFTPDVVVEAYRNGFFPMAESRTGPISWFSPDPRAVIPLPAFHVPRSVRRELAGSGCSCTIDLCFARVIRACAEREDETWISDDIIRVYTDLHRRGLAHSVETWKGEELAGGLYGIAIGGAFFGESMFSRESNMSKHALVHLVERLRRRHYVLLDTQIINDHVRQFGAIEIPRQNYLALLAEAISLPIKFID